MPSTLSCLASVFPGLPYFAYDLFDDALSSLYAHCVTPYAVLEVYFMGNYDWFFARLHHGTPFNHIYLRPHLLFNKILQR